MQITPFPIVLEDAFMLTPYVKHFIFKAEQTPPFNYTAGQFITIHFDYQGKTLKRSYSIANAPSQTNRIEFAAGYVKEGPGTELLFNLKPGDAINITGPFGRLILKDEVPKRYIFVATSTGVTPYRAMMQEIKQRLHSYPELKVVILQGVRSREDILYFDEFKQFAAQHPQVRFCAHLSRSPKDILAEHEYPGYVQHAFPELNLNPQEDIIYLCGNPGMIDESFTYLKEQGFEMQRIIREKYISAPMK
ncbi:MAG: ferredoxin--NADP reductase [Tatlockia sp.]|jgi:ferredoxin-NADP reductase